MEQSNNRPVDNRFDNQIPADLLKKAVRVNEMEFLVKELREELELVRAGKTHFEAEAKKGAKANAALLAEIDGLKEQIHSLENEIMLRDYNTNQQDIHKDVVNRQAQRILALEWLVENTVTQAMEKKDFSLRAQDFVSLVQETLDEYPFHRPYAQPFKEAVRQILNPFVNNTLKKAQ